MSPDPDPSDASERTTVADMSIVAVRTEPVLMVPTYDWDCIDVPSTYRAEVIQGEIVLTPAPVVDHGRIQFTMAKLLEKRMPDGWETLMNIEWRIDRSRLVASAPQPDVIIIPEGLHKVVDPPLLCVEVLSPSDRKPLEVHSDLSRIEGKRIDYGVNGLLDYLEVELDTGRPVVVRYEPRDGVMVEVDRAEGDKALVADRPFAYEIVPSALLPARVV
jgi:Uma2 family endonuclease